MIFVGKSNATKVMSKRSGCGATKHAPKHDKSRILLSQCIANSFAIDGAAASILWRLLRTLRSAFRASIRSRVSTFCVALAAPWGSLSNLTAWPRWRIVVPLFLMMLGAAAVAVPAVVGAFVDAVPPFSVYALVVLSVGAPFVVSVLCSIALFFVLVGIPMANVL